MILRKEIRFLLSYAFFSLRSNGRRYIRDIFDIFISMILEFTIKASDNISDDDNNNNIRMHSSSLYGPYFLSGVVFFDIVVLVAVAIA